MPRREMRAVGESGGHRGTAEVQKLWRVPVEGVASGKDRCMQEGAVWREGLWGVGTLAPVLGC